MQRVELRFGYGRRRDRVCAQPVILMTQRRRLDRFLAEQAAAAGAEFRDGARVTGVAAVGERVVAEVDGRRVSGLVLVGADGANGTTARSLHLCEGLVYGVALEGCLAPDSATLGRYRGGAVFELGNVPGGYGWVFPKAEHLNVGVGGLADEAPRLRAHLRRLCAGHGFRFEDLHAPRGWSPRRRTACRGGSARGREAARRAAACQAMRAERAGRTGAHDDRVEPFDRPIVDPRAARCARPPAGI